MSVYKEQKITKPKIDDMIPEILSGDKRWLAEDFIAYLRVGKMNPTWASANSWKCNHKGKGVLYVRLRDGYFSISVYTNYWDKNFEDFIRKENLYDFIVGNLAICRRCHTNSCGPKCGSDAESFSGVTKTFFGKEFGNLCRGSGGDTHFHDPSDADIVKIKKLVEFQME